MNEPRKSKAQLLAEAAVAFEQQVTGRAATSVTVVASNDVLVITLHGVLSPAERALAMSAEGAAQVQELHRQLFTNSLDSLRKEIRRITGIEVHASAAEIETGSGALVQTFQTGTVVQIFLLASNLPTETWTGAASGQ